MTANEYQDGEYYLSVTFTEGDEIKVAHATNDNFDAWYPQTGGNYVIDANHAGTKTIFFRPAGNAEWADFGGYFYIAPNTPTACENVAADAKAVKVLRNGMLVIESNGKQYNVLGEVIR